IAGLAIAAALPHGVTQLEEARERLDDALAMYRPGPDAPDAAHWNEVRREVLDFQRQVLDEARKETTGLESTAASRMETAFDALPAHAGLNATLTMRMLDQLARNERWAMAGELLLLVLVGGGCLLTLFRAARREDRAMSQEDALMTRLERTNADLDLFAGRIA